ncbi:MAG: hypothetical protein KA221_04660 [Vitreoscilla sp.]|nr:hypothetical protein [Vitreoscilla sp.]MBP9539956.1 hypothetical protein [Vitreoscilla sp.]
MGRFKKYLWAACVVMLLCWGIVSLIHNLYLAAQEDEARIANEARLQKLNIPRNENRVHYNIGNIDGYHINIPPGIVDGWITYNGDPNDFDFDAKEKYQRPPISYDSIIAQISFKFRVADAALLQLGTQTEQDYANDLKLKVTPWANVLSNSGEKYPEDIDKFFNNVLESYLNSVGQPLTYTDKVHGLERYQFDYVNNPTAQKTWDMEEVYIYKTQQDQINTIIRCSTNPNFYAHSCQQFFHMPDNEMEAYFEVRYPRELLPEWQNIEQHTIAILNGFALTH